MMLNNKDFVLYSITNRYISTIQKGIQTAHAAVELVKSHPRDNHIFDWADKHKTIRVLETGSNQDLLDLKYNLSEADIRYGMFMEPELSNTITAICFVIDWSLFEVMDNFDNIFTPEQQLDFMASNIEAVSMFRVLRMIKPLRSAT